MNKYILIVGIVAVAGIGWYVWSTGAFTQAPADREREEGLAEMSEPEVVNEITVNLEEQNGSGESGIAIITEVETGIRVVLRLTGAPEGVTQPVHIHVNSCTDIGGVQYPLEFTGDGYSETMLEVSMATLQAGLPLSINVHKSDEEASVYVACGDIVL